MQPDGRDLRHVQRPPNVPHAAGRRGQVDRREATRPRRVCRVVRPVIEGGNGRVYHGDEVGLITRLVQDGDGRGVDKHACEGKMRRGFCFELGLIVRKLTSLIFCNCINCVIKTHEG